MKRIIDGWRDTYNLFLWWIDLLKAPYNDYNTWEFFSSMNQEVKDPFVMYLSAKDFDALVERLNAPPDPAAVEKIRKVLERKSPWDT